MSRRAPAVLRLVAPLLVTACASGGASRADVQPAAATSAASPARVTQWRGTLASANGAVTGTITLSPTDDGARTLVQARLPVERGRYVWHVHRGSCADKGRSPTLGPAAGYVEQSTARGEMVSVSTVIEAPLPQDGRYYADLHVTPSVDFGLPIYYCAELKARRSGR